MSDQLPDTYWNPLGKNGAFMRALLDSQVQQLQQLQLHNQELQNHILNTQNNLTNAISAAHPVTTPAPTIPLHIII